MSSTTRPSRNGERDAYYTPDAVARACIKVTRIPAGATVLEPSVGGGTLFGRTAGLRVIDLFAGGGGASEGIRQGTGFAPIVAINHCAHAIAMHTANHPTTEHYHASVFDIAPYAAARGRSIDLLWASPDCTHFSRAKGGKPRDKGIRALAWVVVDWAREVRPRCIALENVPEFVTWGPLDDEGNPIKAQAGETFREFTAALRELGYAVEHRVLCAADYGAPTSRRRLYLIARCDGAPLRWPAPTHGPGRPLPWHTAAECIDWSLPIPSIFDRARPLAEATQRRIAEGVRRYVLDCADPFLLCLTYGGRLEPITAPLRTTTTAHRGERAIVAPVLAKAHSHGWDGNGSDLRGGGEPMWTVTGKDGSAIVAPVLVTTSNGEREGQAPRVRDIRRPLGTVTGTGSQGALVAAFLARHFGGARPPNGKALSSPMPTVTAVDHNAVTAVFLDKLHGSALAGQRLDIPAPTVTGGGGRGGGHAALVAAFLLKYYKEGGQWSACGAPMDTVTAKARMGLVTVQIRGEEYVLADIGMRMLQPRELARAQGFSDDYILTGTKSQQVARIGNSVCPPVARAIAGALVG